MAVTEPKHPAPAPKARPVLVPGVNPHTTTTFPRIPGPAGGTGRGPYPGGSGGAEEMHMGSELPGYPLPVIPMGHPVYPLPGPMMGHPTSVDTWRCDACGGAGHQAFECPSVFTLPGVELCGYCGTPTPEHRPTCRVWEVGTLENALCPNAPWNFQIPSSRKPFRTSHQTANPPRNPTRTHGYLPACHTRQRILLATPQQFTGSVGWAKEYDRCSFAMSVGDAEALTSANNIARCCSKQYRPILF